MQTQRAKSIVWWRAATAILLAALIIQTFASGIQPAARTSNDGLSHQPSTFGQMQALVTPQDPLVLQALADALNPPMPEPVTITAYGTTYEFVPTQDKADFALIIAWLYAHCVYTSDIETHGVTDYWQTPAETIALGSGDCEDYSTLLCSLLRAYGVPADEVYVVVGYTAAGEAHSWLVEKNRTGIWRLYDSQKASESQGLVIDTPQASSLKTSYCFNDSAGFYGEPTLPPGICEFESAACSNPEGTGSVNSYSRYLNAGQKISVTVDWLPYTVEWPFNPLVVEPWSLNIYAENGEQVFSWSGTDNQKTLEYAIERTGIYRLEIVKHDNPARPCRLTITPQGGWSTGKPLRIDLLRVEQPPFPIAGKSAVIETPPDTPPAVWQDDAPRVPAPVEVPREKLVQHALDTINTLRASSGLPPIGLGTNLAAQQQADDMLEHRFVSGWGTDGSLPDERYALAGGQGTQLEREFMTDIGWRGDPALFTDAVLTSVEQAVKECWTPKRLVSLSSYYSLTTSETSTDYEQYKLMPDRVNIGVAFDGEKLYLVLQYESFYLNFTQPPTIQMVGGNGVLSVAGRFSPGVTPYLAYSSFQPLSGPLTAAQISYAPFLDPHLVPLDLPPLQVTGFDLTSLMSGLYKNFGYTFSRSSPEVKGSDFAFSFNFDTPSENGVYTVTIGGIISTGNNYLPPLYSNYYIFVN
jgi:hypothetical protein